MLEVLKTLARAEPKQEITTQGRIAILTGGPDAPGMNSTLRTAFRIAMNEGRDVVGVRDGFAGLARGDIWDLHWMDVQQWGGLGGSELGAVRCVLSPENIVQVAGTIKQWDIRGLIAVGGLETYTEVVKLVAARDSHPELKIPMICVPATINNNLPATETTVGADTALNNIVDAVDKIKYTAGSAHRAFIVEVMGRKCGYLTLMSSIASGAEMEILPEDMVTLEVLLKDVKRLKAGFECGKKLGLIIMAEEASPHYDSNFVRRIMEAECEGAFDVRIAILGHMQRGGVPTAFDRIQGSRLGAWAARQIMADIAAGRTSANVIGILRRGVVITPLADAMALMDWTFERPLVASFLRWRSLADTLAKPGPGPNEETNC
jgi:6-phosphofructokinase 1